MAGIAAGYDLSVSTFSPDGRVFQVEYASKAVDNSTPSIAFICSDGVVSAAEKLLPSRMTLPESGQRIHAVDRHCGINVCGFPADGRQIVLRARAEAENYRKVFGGLIPGAVLAERVAHFVHVFTLAWSVRPFGAAVLLTVFDKPSGEKPELYAIEPEGTCFRFFGMAFGKGRQAAKTEIEKLNTKALTCQQAIPEITRIFKAIQDEQKKNVVVEVSWQCPASGFEFQKVPMSLIDPPQQELESH